MWGVPLGPLAQNLPDPDNTITSLWIGTPPSDGVEAANTWTERNISSTTSNGAGDVTLTFAVAYGATPYAGASCLDSGNVVPAATFTSLTTTAARVTLTGVVSGAAVFSNLNLYIVFGGR